MSKEFKYLGPGEQPTEREYNRLLDLVAGLLDSSGVQYYRDSRGVHVRLSPQEPPTIRAFVKATPGATTDVVVYLRKDDSETEVTVVCEIYGGGNLEDAYPTLVDGMPLYVQYDKEADEWKNVTSIYKIGLDCNE